PGPEHEAAAREARRACAAGEGNASDRVREIVAARSLRNAPPRQDHQPALVWVDDGQGRKGGPGVGEPYLAARLAGRAGCEAVLSGRRGLIEAACNRRARRGRRRRSRWLVG